MFLHTSDTHVLLHVHLHTRKHNDLSIDDIQQQAALRSVTWILRIVVQVMLDISSLLFLKIPFFNSDHREKQLLFH